MESLLVESEVAHQKRARMICIIVLALYVLFLQATLVRGQATADVPIDSDWVTLIAQESDVLSGTISDKLAGMDLENMSKREWKRLRNEELEGIRSQDKVAWRTAAVDIIYLTLYHGDKINLQRASLPLMYRYIFDSDENDRILALAGMHAIGHRDTMARLSQRVRLEGSDRVRRLTVAAVRDYFDRPQGTIDVRSEHVNTGVAIK